MIACQYFVVDVAVHMRTLDEGGNVIERADFASEFSPEMIKLLKTPMGGSPLYKKITAAQAAKAKAKPKAKGKAKVRKFH